MYTLCIAMTADSITNDNRTHRQCYDNWTHRVNTS